MTTVNCRLFRHDVARLSNRFDHVKKAPESSTVFPIGEELAPSSAQVVKRENQGQAGLPSRVIRQIGQTAEEEIHA
jgi:hypothetical protein